jgi:hypothetical protein
VQRPRQRDALPLPSRQHRPPSPILVSYPFGSRRIISCAPADSVTFASATVGTELAEFFAFFRRQADRLRPPPSITLTCDDSMAPF